MDPYVDPIWIPVGILFRSLHGSYMDPYMDPIWIPIWILYGSLYGSYMDPLYGSHMDPYPDKHSRMLIMTRILIVTY